MDTEDKQRNLMGTEELTTSILFPLINLSDQDSLETG